MKFFCTVCCLALVLAFVGCKSDEGGSDSGGSGDGGGSASSGFDSPQAVVDAAIAAAKAKDHKGFYECVSPDSQNMLVFMGVGGGGYMGFVEGKEGVKAALEKHGLTQEKCDAVVVDDDGNIPDMSAVVSDMAGFYVDISNALAEAGDSGGPMDMLGAATVKDVKEDGDKATGKIAMGDIEDESILSKSMANGEFIWLTR